ncbi:hypothetical protein OA002_02335 [bacterium]|nr:hypothetical protein [bacterium]
MSVNNLINESREHQALQQAESHKLVSKWEKTGLLEGLNEGYQQNNMARLLENQATQLLKEASTTSPAGGTVGADFKGNEEWSGVALPLVRRIFAEIAAQDFVSVQPMNLPSGLVFYLDFQHGVNRMHAQSGDPIFGKTGKFSPSGSSAPFPEKGFYGAGKYGFTMATSSAVYSVDDSTNTVTRATMKDINFDADVTGSNINLWKIQVSFGSEVDSLTPTITDADKLAVRAWDIYQTGSDNANAAGKPLYGAGGTTEGWHSTLNQFSSVTGTDGENGVLTYIVSGSATESEMKEGWAVHYPKRNTEASRGDFEDTTANATQDSLQIPEIKLELKSRPIVAKTRKLKAVWTPELAQDLNAYHSVDAEAELTSMLSEYISMEIDLEILDMLISDAQTVDFWSAKQGNDYNATTTEFENTTFYGTRFEWYQTLVAKIQKMSNEIHRLTLRGGANFVVCSPKIATILESLPGYNANLPGGDIAANQQFAMGVSKIGAVNNQFQVYKNPYMDENTILVGFRGTNFLETGAVYSPYVPLIMTPLVYDPSDFTPRKGVMTRYAKKMIRPEFYGKIFCADLDLI